MKIELNKKQYKTLLTVMYCGEWVLNSHKTDDDKLSDEILTIKRFKKNEWYKDKRA